MARGAAHLIQSLALGNKNRVLDRNIELGSTRHGIPRQGRRRPTTAESNKDDAQYHGGDGERDSKSLHAVNRFDAVLTVSLSVGFVEKWCPTPEGVG